jgi:murein DD-endopeptidase MepM/ murein hydrolase activator NlpD
VAIKAGCDGKVLFKQWVSGYGGTVVTECELENKAVTVLYGHLSLTSISFQVGDFITAGDIIGYLGADNSEETDQERKHLHLSIHQGQTVNLRGYVNSEAELEDWLDPCDYICD